MLNDQNSWVTIIYANKYFIEKWGASFWASLTIPEKESLLITAKNLILQLGYDIADTNQTKSVKDGQCETAQFIYEFFTDYNKRRNLAAAGVSEFKVKNFSEKMGKIKLPENIANILGDYKTGGGNYIGEISRDINR